MDESMRAGPTKRPAKMKVAFGHITLDRVQAGFEAEEARRCPDDRHREGFGGFGPRSQGIGPRDRAGRR